MSEEHKDQGKGKPDHATNRHEPTKNDRKPNNPSYGERKGGHGKGGENQTDPRSRMRGDQNDRTAKQEEWERQRQERFDEKQKEIEDMNAENEGRLTYAKFKESNAMFSVTAASAVKIEKHGKLPADLMELLNKRPPKRKEHILGGCVIKPE
ncbi:hypothetical protein GL50803_006171 [Giardia duodenalis]|uniref:Uncharacterized protein n=1 Tax=Giardia intestinalis (strain ATCC 50803 / WB clone C6) TaxID=184922 RepID=A8BRN9_GIAIC|nr:hypothetical protein GL50803_006171 [Giardia intestinalis]KAE8305968.1 hypothetical protein GL50803_006171 [Giardia intestinalis]|eukprot:XP_001705314.1 Hypothetical protein GL50803_6171 [Giardia lamblia ATCC 50803]